MPLSARELALAPPHAAGVPPVRGVLRAAPEDFVVEEELGFAPSGHGEHLLLEVRKRDANTAWVARELARLAGCRPAEVGYAGLKDRRAVAVQWFSLPRPRQPIDWGTAGCSEFVVLAAHPHHRKLRRGALAGNRFNVLVGAADGDAGRLAALVAPRLEHLARHGVPNYFGPQRFGRNGANLDPGAAGASGLAPFERGIRLSAARSLMFNAVLAERVCDGTWNSLRPGDLANLDGRGSIFPVDEPDTTLAGRCERLEIHPTGPLWGKGAPPTGGTVLELETRTAARFTDASALCVAAGLRQERRSLRLRVEGLDAALEAHGVRLRFRLSRGAFATAVLRELVDVSPEDSSQSESST